MLISAAGMGMVGTPTVVLYRGLTTCMMVGQDLCGQRWRPFTELSLVLFISVEQSLLPWLYCLLCLSISLALYLVDLTLLIYLLGQSVILLEGMTTIRGPCALKEAAFFCFYLPSLHFFSFPSSPFSVKYLLGLQFIKCHFIKSCFHLSKMAVRLKLFYCVRSQKNIKKNPFLEWNNTAHFSSVFLIFLLMAL